VSNLAAWLNAQIDHDDLTRREALDHLLDGGRSGFDWSSLPDPVRVFVMTWTPGRAELEVAAYRRILRDYETALTSAEVAEGTPLAGATRLSLRLRREAVLAIASIYSDRPGFDPAWTVE